ncbi:hypothetical protein G7Y89_g13698 [Cudoniella acicularis]|uniref:Uncharacterized protein n=1 Tax=Cudoniella acicularis TaxID=354080 RepID=A0A8H4RA58_9HELO|nr:hypothetical protein G7Y89_g13698 [Cudoniella acicularis]
MLTPPVFPRFLDLAPSLRRRIYEHAGLVVNNDLDLVLHSELEGKQPGSASPNLSSSRALMLVCHAVHEETSLLLYSTNRFVIRFQQAGDLRALRNLRPQLIGTFTCLTVQLNVGKVADPQWIHSSNCPSFDDELLSVHNPAAQLLLAEWGTTADYLSRCITPHALDFGLVCDVDDLETAQRVVEPLFTFPKLAACHIRLHHSRSPMSSILLKGLQKIAYDTGVQVEEKRAFAGFSNLPPELRLRILGYTDLVTPFNQIQWSYQVDRPHCYELGRPRACRNQLTCKPPYDACHPNTHRTCQWTQCLLSPAHDCQHFPPAYYQDGQKPTCWLCGHYACQFQKCWMVKKRGRHQNPFCLCQRKHVSYSPFCTCWAPPTPLFLVSRGFQQEAQQVFFGENNFKIMDSRYIWSESPLYIKGPTRRHGNRYAESVFLNDVVPASAVPYIRSLELSFSFLGEINWPYTSHSQPAFKDLPVEHPNWLRTIGLLMSDGGLGLNLSSLFLKITVSTAEEMDPWFTSRPKMPLENPDAAIDALKAIASSFWPPLINNPRLHVFHAHIVTDYVQGGYFILPVNQDYQNQAKLCPEPGTLQYLTTSRIKSDMYAERRFPGVESGGEWVEGMWADHKIPH